MENCEHPLAERGRFPECCVEPGVDCWGYRPHLPLKDIVDIIGVILSEGFENWSYQIIDDDNIKVFGRKSD